MTDPPAEGDAPALGRLRVHPFGDRAWLIEPASEVSGDWVLELARRVRACWPGSLVVPGLASVLLARTATWDGMEASRAAPGSRPAPRSDTPVLDVETVDPSSPWPTSGAEVVAAVSAATGPSAEGRRAHVHLLAARYDGPDLETAAASAGLSPGELIARHVAAEWTVAAVGFSPGFGYLTCADAVFAAIGRRDDPRPRVPAGSIALAAGLCAVYPSATPGGWQLVGSTDAVLWELDAAAPARLQVGDRVRFEAT